MSPHKLTGSCHNCQSSRMASWKVKRGFDRIPAVCVNIFWSYATHTCLTSPKWDQEGHVSLHRACATGRGLLLGRVCSTDVPVQANQRWWNSRRRPHLFEKGQAGVSTQESARAAGTVQTRYCGPVTQGNLRSGRDFQSVEVWHCLPLHCGLRCHLMIFSAGTAKKKALYRTVWC